MATVKGLFQDDVLSVCRYSLHTDFLERDEAFLKEDIDILRPNIIICLLVEWVAVIQQQTGQRVERAATYRNEGRVRRGRAVTALGCAFADGFCHVVELQALASLYR